MRKTEFFRFDLLVGDSIEWNHLAENWITERVAERRERNLVEIDLAPLRAAGRFACGFHNDADFLSAIFFFFTFAVNAMESFR